MEKSGRDKGRVLLQPKALFIYMEIYRVWGKVLNGMANQGRGKHPTSPPYHHIPFPAEAPMAKRRPRPLRYFFVCCPVKVYFSVVLFNHRGNEVSTL